MKKHLYIFIICLGIFTNVNSTVLLVNGNNGGPGQYTRIDTAIAHAVAGDTIYVSGAALIYADFTINKSLTLIGPGNYRQTQSPAQAKVGTIGISAGISNVKLSGFWVNNNLNLGSGNTFIEISNNYINGLSYNFNCANIIISNNIFDHVNWPSCTDYTGLANILIENCIFNGGVYAFQATNSTFNHCFFYNGGSNVFQDGCGHIMKYVNIKNCIFYKAGPLTSVDTNTCVFNNNITYSTITTYPNLPGTGNINNTDPQFISYPTAGGNFVYGYNYHLNITSPGHNAADDGTDIGYYGGGYPATQTGEVYGFPVIRQMNITNTAVPQNGNVDVKVRSTKPREH